MLSYRYEWINKAILLSEASIENSLIVQGILDGETLTGDARSVSAYLKSALTICIYFTESRQHMLTV